MQAPQTPLPAYCCRHAGISGSALAQACRDPTAPGFPPAPPSPKTAQSTWKRRVAELIIAKKKSLFRREAQDTQRAAKEQGKRKEKL